MADLEKSITELLSIPGRWFYGGLEDITAFLSGPPQGVFKCPPDFKWPRLLRLMAIALLLSGVGLSAGNKFDPGKSYESIIATSPVALMLLTAGIFISLFYAMTVARLCRVKITVTESLFTLLLMSLPWLPLTFFVRLVGDSLDVGLLVMLWFFVAASMVITNISRGICKLNPACSKLLIWSSVIATLVLFMILLVGLQQTWSLLILASSFIVVIAFLLILRLATSQFARRTPNGNPQPIENPSAGPEALTAATQLVSSDSQGRVVPRERISL